MKPRVQPHAHTRSGGKVEGGTAVREGKGKEKTDASGARDTSYRDATEWSNMREYVGSCTRTRL